jgi:hypothetical protein
MGRVSDEICRENHDTFLLNSVFTKFMFFMRSYGKNMAKTERPQVTIQYGACALQDG